MYKRQVQHRPFIDADIGSAGSAVGPARRASAAEPDGWRAGGLTILRPIQVPAWLERLAAPLALLWRRLRYGYAFRRIPLTQGLYALVDPEDYESLARHKWHATRGRTTFYAQRKVWDPVTRREITIKMHRQILHVRDGLLVDHVSRNGLDNRKANLRSATPAQNACNPPRAGRPDRRCGRGAREERGGQTRATRRGRARPRAPRGPGRGRAWERRPRRASRR